MQVLLAQLCLTLCSPMDCIPPGSSIHGIFQPRILEWEVMLIQGSIPPALIQGSIPPALQGDSLPSEPPAKPRIGTQKSKTVSLRRAEQQLVLKQGALKPHYTFWPSFWPVLWSLSLTKHLSVYCAGITLVPQDVKLKTWPAVLP